MDLFKGCKRISRLIFFKYVKVFINWFFFVLFVGKKNEKEKKRNGIMVIIKEEYYLFLCGCWVFCDFFEILIFMCFGCKYFFKIFFGFCIVILFMKMWNIYIMIIKYKLKELYEVYVVLMILFNN